MRNLFYLLLSTTLTLNVFSQEQTVGLFTNENASFDGYTLFAPNKSYTTYLIDNCGRMINSWTSEYLPGSAVYFLEDGHLLRTCNVTSDYFSGGGLGGRIEKYDWDGNLVWHFDYHNETHHAHHDIEALPNGNILLIAWDSYTASEAINSGRDPLNVQDVFWSDKIVELEPVGFDQANIVWEWKAWDHLIQDIDPGKANYGDVKEHPELLNINYSASQGPNANKDWTHLNSIDYNPELNQIMVSSRNLSEFWIIDRSTSTEAAAGHTGGYHGKGGDLIYRYGNPEAYSRGSIDDRMLFFQHDANWVTNYKPDLGKIIVFSNQVAPITSAVVILNPPIDETGLYKDPGSEKFGPATYDWSYTSTDIFSSGQSGVERLPNGNTLISTAVTGQIIELDMDKKLIWKYINPVGSGGPITQGTSPVQNIIFKSQRYSPAFPGFTNFELTPGDLIELDPYPSNCIISPDTLIEIDLTVFLEGSYKELAMTTQLKKLNLLPLAQPYKSAPWNYPGSETVDKIPNEDIVDWVLIELRDAEDAASAEYKTSISRQVGFLKKDGSIVSLDGTSHISFYNSFDKQLFVVIWHRNHLELLSSETFNESNGTFNYNFSETMNSAYGGDAGHKEVAPGIWAMIAGDGLVDGQITILDKDQVWDLQTGTKGYLSGDFNLDGIIDNIDKNDILLPNLGEESQVQK